MKHNYGRITNGPPADPAEPVPDLITTDATQRTLVARTLPENSIVVIHGHVVAISGANVRLYTAYGLFKRGAGNAVLAGQAAPISPIGDALAASVALDVQPSSAVARVRVTGINGVTITWVPDIAFAVLRQ